MTLGRALARLAPLVFLQAGWGVLQHALLPHAPFSLSSHEVGDGNLGGASVATLAEFLFRKWWVWEGKRVGLDCMLFLGGFWVFGFVTKR